PPAPRARANGRQMIRCFAVALAACGAPNVHPTVAPRPAPDAAIAQADGDAPRMVTARAPRVAIAAPHAGRIRLVAVTADGGAVLSCDEFAGARLWPALDGSAEPRVVDLPEAQAVAIGKRDDGFAVLAIDQVGGLY